MNKDQKIWSQAEQGVLGNLGEFKMSEEKPKMKPVTWDDVDLSGKFVKLEDGDVVTLVSVNRKLVNKEVAFKNETPQMKDVFSCDVVEYNGKKLEGDNIKVIETSSKPFLKALKDVLIHVKDDDEPVKLQILRSGTLTNTTYKAKRVD